jgi:hypothetical protein
MLVSNRQGGAFVEESALLNPREAESNWNEANPMIMVTDGSLGRGAIHERNPIPYPQGLDRMMEWAIQALPQVSGINLEMMGFADREQANVLELQRKKSALTVLADIFDSFRRFTKERGRVVLYFIQTYINDGRLIRVTGQNGQEQYIPLALRKDAVKYDTIVDEAPSSPNQKEEVFAVMMQLAPLLIQAGIPVPPELVSYLPLPQSLISKMQAQTDPNKGPSPQEQMAMADFQKEQEKKEAEIEEIRVDSRLKLEKAETEAIERRQKAADAAAQEIQNQAVSQGLMDVSDL